ncbi:hypothetical protein BGX26_012480 [Mortierella sp. AD094]|nr:hypothetical protein BGX26_012480 [Mortierella sp. AD094]
MNYNKNYQSFAISLVADYLERKDWIGCLYTCKAWRDGILPVIWKDISICNSTTQSPTPEFLTLHKHLVFSLKIFRNQVGEYAIWYPELCRLVISCDDPQALVSLNPSLEKLKVRAHGRRLALTPGFWEAVSGLSKLSKLTLDSVIVSSNQVRSIWEACAHVQIMHLRQVSFASIEDASRFVDNIPRLRLRKLSWTNCPLPSHDLSQVIRSMQSATKFTLGSSKFGPDSFEALELHFRTLEKLDLLHCEAVTSLMIREILSHCQMLKVLKADSILAVDVIAIQILSCVGIENLQLQIVFDNCSSDRTLDRQVFQVLSAMTQLKCLVCGNNRHQTPDQSRRGLDFRLESGMGALASLTQLSALTLDTITATQQIGEVDVEWMSITWKNLRFVHGYIHIDDSEDSKLKGILRSRQIYVY